MIEVLFTFASRLNQGVEQLPFRPLPKVRRRHLWPQRTLSDTVEVVLVLAVGAIVFHWAHCSLPCFQKMPKSPVLLYGMRSVMGNSLSLWPLNMWPLGCLSMSGIQPWELNTIERTVSSSRRKIPVWRTITNTPVDSLGHSQAPALSPTASWSSFISGCLLQANQVPEF